MTTPQRWETDDEREATDALAKLATTDELRFVIGACRWRGKAIDLERADVYEAELRRREEVTP